MFIRFDRMYERNRQTHIHTDRHRMTTWAPLASHGKNCQHLIRDVPRYRSSSARVTDKCCFLVIRINNDGRQQMANLHASRCACFTNRLGLHF